MGGDQSQQNKRETQQGLSPLKSQKKIINSGQDMEVEEEEFFILQNQSKIKLQGTLSDMVFLWIDPRIYNEENGKNSMIFKEKLNVQEFSSINSLQKELNQIDSNKVVTVISAASLPDQNYKYMNSEIRIWQIILFCQNEERAELLMKNFKKISSACYNASQVLSRGQEFKKKYPTKGLIKNSILFMTEDDASLMNKYRLNYFCLTNQKNSHKAKKDFIRLATKLFPNETSIINQFSQNYQISSDLQKRKKQVLEWVFRDSFYWNLVENQPKISTDPKKLAYLRLPFKDIYQTILSAYKQNKSKPSKLFIVFEPTQQEQLKLGDNEENYLIFTTFIKGFTNQAKANAEWKKIGSKAFKFDVLLAQNLHEDLDFGFLVVQDDKTKPGPNVIFNLYNFFKLSQINLKAKVGTIEYGFLAKLVQLREIQKQRMNLGERQKNLLRNFDYLQDLMKKIKSQGNVLQLSGYFKDSIEVYDRKLEEIVRTNKSAAMLDELKIQKADTLKILEEYDNAEKQYLSVQTDKLKLITKVRLIELYYLRKNQAKALQIIEDLKDQINNLKQWGFAEEYFRAKNFIGLSMMKKEKFKEAKAFYRQLRVEISTYYGFKYQGIPLVHQIYKNLALSETKLNNHEEALNLLNSTKSWQLSSEGKGPALVYTERLIQSIHHIKGDSQRVQESKRNAKKIIQSNGANIDFIDASRGSAKAQRIIQQSLINIDLEQIEVRPAKPLLQQSEIYIDI